MRRAFNSAKACCFTVSLAAALGVLLEAAPAQAPVGGRELELVARFLESVKGHLARPGDEQGYRAQIRVLLGELDGVAALASGDLKIRRELLERARKALTSGVALELGGGPEGDVAARALVEGAAKAARQARIDALERGIICWCPEENWTRTLAGCAQGCAEPQKALVRQWIDEGSTDEEVVARMVGHPMGDPRVRAMPLAEGSNWVGYLFPGVLAALALVFVVLVLRRMTRGSRSPVGSTIFASEASFKRDSKGDAEMGEQIERELKEMEE